MIKLRWYLMGRFVGRSETEKGLVHGVFRVPNSITVFCKDCGKTWLKIKVVSDETMWESKQRLCPSCGPAPVAMSECRSKWKYPLPEKLDKYELEAMKRCGGMKGYEAHLITGGA